MRCFKLIPLLLLFGCALTPVTAPIPAVVRQPRGQAVVVGLTKVDPAHYDGWDGACPGSDVDADVFALLCQEQGLGVQLLVDSAATGDNVATCCQRAWEKMNAGELFVLYVSGHGGQVPDTDGDEEDGMDETLCLYDGYVTDDTLRTFWEQIPDGVRVFFVTDTCNSGTNFRFKPLTRRSAANPVYKGEMIHFGGCADGFSSYGNESGGSWTTALIDSWVPGQCYLYWFAAAKKKMPRDQVPYYAEHGIVGDSFRFAPALR